MRIQDVVFFQGLRFQFGFLRSRIIVSDLLLLLLMFNWCGLHCKA